MITQQKQTIYLTINNHQIPIWIYGKQTNPLLFVIHGYPTAFSHFSGDLPIKYLMNDYCLVAVDLPEFGENKNLQMDFIAFLELVITHVAKKRKFVLFAASFGGFIASQFAAKEPKNLSGLIIAGTPIFSYRLMQFFKPLTVFKNHFFLKHYNYFLFMQKENLQQISIPVLLLYSSKDKIAGIKYGEKLQRILPDAKLTTTDLRKHTWLLHRVDETGFLAAIQKFLKEVFKQK